ncbi:signal transduction histidine kinase [Mycetocola sp. CAN_C7]|uniref:sensor histidine kinase n=1 Tax=Mycetocola sp. CAN_C7 TaxID=2787724 RepID=UPI0018CBA988
MVTYAQTETESATIAVAQILHHAVWRRFPPGAIAYTEALRQKISTANQESRNYVARELHDRVAHNLAASIQRIELGVLDLDGAEGSQHFDAAACIIRTALTDVQSISFDLRQRVGTDFLDDAIRKYVDNVIGTESEIVVVSEGSPRLLPSAQAEELFMIAIEAIRNSRRHAGPASRVMVSLVWRDADLSLFVVDDGPGIPKDATSAKSLGIIGMEERAGAIGADMSVHSTKSGVAVHIHLPLSSKVDGT